MEFIQVTNLITGSLQTAEKCITVILLHYDNYDF